MTRSGGDSRWYVVEQHSRVLRKEQNGTAVLTLVEWVMSRRIVVKSCRKDGVGSLHGLLLDCMPIAGRDGKSQASHNLSALATLLAATDSIALVVGERSHAALHGSMAIGGASSEREGVFFVKRAVVIHGSKRAVRALRLGRRVLITRHDALLAVGMTVVLAGVGGSKARRRLKASGR